MRYTILASVTAGVLAFGAAQASAQDAHGAKTAQAGAATTGTNTNVSTSESEKMKPQGDLGAGVNSSASSQAHTAGQTSSGRSSAPAGSTNPSATR